MKGYDEKSCCLGDPGKEKGKEYEQADPATPWRWPTQFKRPVLNPQTEASKNLENQEGSNRDSPDVHQIRFIETPMKRQDHRPRKPATRAIQTRDVLESTKRRQAEAEKIHRLRRGGTEKTKTQNPGKERGGQEIVIFPQRILYGRNPANSNHF